VWGGGTIVFSAYFYFLITRDENRKIKKNHRTEKRGFGKIQRKGERGEREG
jgi:hypothetical protein